MKLNIKQIMEQSRSKKLKLTPSVATVARLNEATQLAIDTHEPPHQPVTIPKEEVVPLITGNHHDSLAMEKLVEADFPFDDSQRAAINAIASQHYACLTGAAGTGKTTCVKALIDGLTDSVGAVDMDTYFANADSMGIGQVASIAMVAFTGRATQMIKRNFPESWHANIMTIHRLLHYVPESYEAIDDDNNIVVKMRFVPTYTAGNLMPWDAIVIDESGMLGVDLWENLYAAMKPGCRIIMVGDINQLPPVHGASIFGYAMIKWPAYELTHIHRQKGGSCIVDNAWRILQGEMPVKGKGFNMLNISSESKVASKTLRAAMIKLSEAGSYDPIRDTAIVATNGKPGSRGEAIGQMPLNIFMAIQFNPDAQRWLIDAGRERKGFAPGDKVMVTKNDHKRSLTNGMTGVVTEIVANAQYTGELDTCGPVDDIMEIMRQDKTRFDVNEMVGEVSAQEKVKEENKAGRGAASHSVRVEFEHGVFTFSTFAEVASLDLAYVITCHKSQGGEYPMVIILVHDANAFMMYREWLYTAVTRASERVLLLYNDRAMNGALRKQRIKGSTLKAKAQKFIDLAKNPLKKTPSLPEPKGDES